MRAAAQFVLPLLLALACAGGCQRRGGLATNQPLFGGAPTPGNHSPPSIAPPEISIEMPGANSSAAAGRGSGNVNSTPAASVAGADNSRLNSLQRQLSDLERNNEDLHRQIASSSQQSQLLKDQVGLLQRQLSDTASQLRDSQVARDEADRRAQATLASNRQPGAVFNANNSVKQSLQVVSLPGLDVRQDGELIRIEIPADKLFKASSVEWVSGANTILDQVGDAVARSYPRQQVVIEAHTDNAIVGLPGGSQQLAASQAVAVYQHMTAKNRIPPKQLTTMACGPNFPRVSNAYDEGRSKNRRIELVIYPEQAK